MAASKRVLLACVWILAAALPARAQFLGYTSPQTVQQKIFSGQTGAITSPAAFTFNCVPSNGSPCAIQNIGQSIHSVLYTVTNACTTALGFDLRLEGTNDGTNWFAISEDATDQTSSNAVQGYAIGGLTAVGSYAGYRLNLVQNACPGGTVPAVSAIYSGTSTSTPTPAGVFYQAQSFRKLILQNVATTSTAGQSITIPAPNATSFGQLGYVCFNSSTGALANCPAMTITVNGYMVNGASTAGNIVSSGNTLSVMSTSSSGFLPLGVGGGPALSLQFTFSGAGTAGVNWSLYWLSNAITPPVITADPCGTPGYPKSSARVQISTATTTLIAANTGGTNRNFICGGYMEISSSATTASTVQFEYGTQVSTPCDTGATPLSGTMGSGTATSGIQALPIFLGSGMTQMVAPPGQQICVVTAGTTVSVNGYVTYAQQ